MRILLIPIMFLMLLVACNNGKVSRQVEGVDTIESEGYPQTQIDINMESNKGIEAYEDSVETDYLRLLSAFPQYKAEFEKEKAAWMEYKSSVEVIARCEDHGSSTPMFVNDVIRDAISLREYSFYPLYKHTQGIEYPFCKTKFTSAMIADAYSVFIKAVSEDEDVEDKTAYQDALRNEQQWWGKWMECREAVSQKLSNDLKKVYDDCTNLTTRTKLIQLKNQNEGHGLTSGEILDCILPDDCSDKALMEYPGFDKVWAKHCEDLDWYPTFD